MTTLTEETLSLIEIAARQNFPNEMCGVILTDGRFVKFENLSEKPTTSFKLDSLKYVELEQDVAFIIHSHTQNTHLHPITPSLADLELSKATGKPLFICAIKHGVYYPPMKVPPDPNRDYLGRSYIFGVQDCGILARDYYHFELGIEIRLDLILHLYTKRYWEQAAYQTLVNNNMVNLINFSEARLKDTADNIELIDITKTHKLQKGDILITSTNGMFKNHAMVWTGQACLNQSDVSKLDPLELHINKLTAVFRHPSLMV
jgi:proteasome lid subunit RPN8/RPN11